MQKTNSQTNQSVNKLNGQSIQYKLSFLEQGISISYINIICIVLIILYIYFVQFYKIDTDHKVFIEDAIENKLFKTGDIILFKASNNFNSIKTATYFGHTGVVVCYGNEVMLFEANGIERVPLKERHNKNGMFLTPLHERVSKYKGRCFLKALNNPLDENVINLYKEFISWAIQNMYYEYNVFRSVFKKLLGMERCHNGTNCAEIVFISLIRLGLIPASEFDNNIMNHLQYVADIKTLKNGYEYSDLIELVDHPFAY
jgi:hypothetical protein